MNQDYAPSRAAIPTWVALLVGVVALVVAAAALTAALLGNGASPAYGGMMGWGLAGGTSGRGGMMGPGFGPTTGRFGMMGSGVGAPNGTQPGQAGFVAGTVAAPRLVRVFAGPGYAFSPSTVSVARGETVTFEVTTMGPLTHEFMVGPADAVAADRAGTPEVADIGMMQTKSLTYTFDGSGPYAFACHATGHYEAGMRGTIVLVP